MAYADPTVGARRTATVAGVVLVHGALGYLLVSGMAVDVMRGVTRTLTTTNVPLSVPPLPDPTPPPPRAEHVAAHPSQPMTVTFVDPVVPSHAADERVMVDVLPVPPLPLATGEPAATATPFVSKASGPAVRGDRGAWITNADYPAAAADAEEEGRVALTVGVGTDGRVTTCTVTGSSGSATLDAATCRLYRQRARFTPARDDAGSTIASSYRDRVRWELPR